MRGQHSFYKIICSIAASSLLLFNSLVAQESTLTMDTALQRIIDSSPQLQKDWAEVWVKEGLMTQAGLRPNPMFEFELEDFAGSKKYRGWRHAEVTCALVQVIELGGKRGKRERAAGALRDVAFWDAQIHFLDLCQTLYQSLARAMAAQERFHLVNKRLQISQQTTEFIGERYKSGKETLLQHRKALSSIHLNELALNKGEADLWQTRLQLAQLWGSACVDFECIDFDFYTLTPPPPWCELVSQLADSPDILRLQQISWAAKQEVTLQRSRAIPNVEAFAGVKYHNEDHAYNFIIGAGVPLPIFDRNQGNIASAQAVLSKAVLDEENALLNAQSILKMAHQYWLLAYKQALALQEYVKELEETMRLMLESFSEGKLPYAEVVATQTELLETQDKLFDALLETHLRKAEVERTLGKVCVGKAMPYPVESCH